MRVRNYEVPQRVIDALQTRLRREPATNRMLIDLADTFGVPRLDGIAMRVVDRWLQQERNAGNATYSVATREWKWCSPPAHGDKP